MNDGAPRQFDYDLFLSYSKKDKRRVRRLAERLRGSGLRVWFDDWSIQPGADIPLAIQNGLASSRRFVACWSPAYQNSVWGGAESSTILHSDLDRNDRRLVPVLMVDCDPPDFLRRLKFVDYRTESEVAFLELLSACSPLSPESTFVQPLHVAEDRFLQLLLFQFSLHRRTKNGRKGVELRLCLNDDTPAIWDSQGKRYLLGKLDQAKRKRYQKKLDAFLLHGKGIAFDFNDAEFCFRYASAGTLPIISFVGDEKETQYYCLFYRDVYPIGWNIANGGCDNRAELLDPEITLERELREELIIADFAEDTRYVFPADASKLPDHPAHAVARRLWSKKHNVLDLTTLNAREVVLEWQRGPDSLHIQVSNEKPIPPRSGFYLNINGDDFGIELDRIARIRLPRTVILFDGELDSGWLVNSPVGLFEVKKFNHRLRSGKADFRPDLFFFDARHHQKRKEIDRVLEMYALHVEQFRSPAEVKEFQSARTAGKQYGLCPVTERIIKRHLQDEGC